MKKFIFLLFVFISAYGFSQTTEIIQKAQNMADKYEATGASSSEVQAAKTLFTTYFTACANGTAISSATQTQVDALLSVISNSTTPLSANTLLATYSGELTISDPYYNRAYADYFDISCPTQGNLSSYGDSVYYNVIQFSVTVAGEIDIEVTEFNSYFYGDSYISLYCAFDPLNPLDNLIDTDDDGGYGVLSMFEDITLPVGTYYLVMASYSNYDYGDYTIEFRGDGAFVVVEGASSVPVSIWWIAGIFVLLAAGVVIKKILF